MDPEEGTDLLLSLLLGDLRPPFRTEDDEAIALAPAGFADNGPGEHAQEPPPPAPGGPQGERARHDSQGTQESSTALFSGSSSGSSTSGSYVQVPPGRQSSTPLSLISGLDLSRSSPPASRPGVPEQPHTRAETGHYLSPITTSAPPAVPPHFSVPLPSYYPAHSPNHIQTHPGTQGSFFLGSRAFEQQGVPALGGSGLAPCSYQQHQQGQHSQPVISYSLPLPLQSHHLPFVDGSAGEQSLPGRPPHSHTQHLQQHFHFNTSMAPSLPMSSSSAMPTGEALPLAIHRSYAGGAHASSNWLASTGMVPPGSHPPTGYHLQEHTLMGRGAAPAERGGGKRSRTEEPDPVTDSNYFGSQMRTYDDQKERLLHRGSEGGRNFSGLVDGLAFSHLASQDGDGLSADRKEGFSIAIKAAMCQAYRKAHPLPESAQQRDTQPTCNMMSGDHPCPLSILDGPLSIMNALQKKLNYLRGNNKKDKDVQAFLSRLQENPSGCISGLDALLQFACREVHAIQHQRVGRRRPTSRGTGRSHQAAVAALSETSTQGAAGGAVAAVGAAVAAAATPSVASYQPQPAPGPTHRRHLPISVPRNHRHVRLIVHYYWEVDAEDYQHPCMSLTTDPFETTGAQVMAQLWPLYVGFLQSLGSGQGIPDTCELHWSEDGRNLSRRIDPAVPLANDFFPASHNLILVPVYQDVSQRSPMATTWASSHFLPSIPVAGPLPLHLNLPCDCRHMYCIVHYQGVNASIIPHACISFPVDPMATVVTDLIEQILPFFIGFLQGSGVAAIPHISQCQLYWSDHGHDRRANPLNPNLCLAEGENRPISACHNLILAVASLDATTRLGGSVSVAIESAGSHTAVWAGTAAAAAAYSTTHHQPGVSTFVARAPGTGVQFQQGVASEDTAEEEEADTDGEEDDDEGEEGEEEEEEEEEGEVEEFADASEGEMEEEDERGRDEDSWAVDEVDEQEEDEDAEVERVKEEEEKGAMLKSAEFVEVQHDIFQLSVRKDAGGVATDAMPTAEPENASEFAEIDDTLGVVEMESTMVPSTLGEPRAARLTTATDFAAAASKRAMLLQPYPSSDLGDSALAQSLAGSGDLLSSSVACSAVSSISSTSSAMSNSSSVTSTASLSSSTLTLHDSSSLPLHDQFPSLSPMHREGLGYAATSYSDATATHPLALACDPKDKRFALGSGSKIEIYTFEGAAIELVSTLVGHEDSITSLVYSADGQWIVSSATDKSLRLWSVKSGMLVLTSSGEVDITSVTMTDTTTGIVTGDSLGQVQLWSVTEKGFNEHERFEFAHADLVTSIAINPTGKQAVSASRDHTVRTWSLDQNKKHRVLKGHTDSVTSVVYTSGGKNIISGSFDGTLRMWNASTGASLYAIRQPGLVAITSLTYSPSQRLLAMSSRDGPVHVWDVKSNKLDQTFEGHKGCCERVVVSGDEKQLVSIGKERDLYTWDLE